jgi:two-component system, sensor histidine kinase
MGYDKPKLLLVDDDEVIADILKIFIGDKYQLDSVTNGLAAIKKVKENDYDAFLIDIGLPGGFDGMETTKKLKEINNNREKPYICVTAHCMKGDKEHFLANGLTHYLSKPFIKEKLLTLIEEALKGE